MRRVEVKLGAARLLWGKKFEKLLLANVQEKIIKQMETPIK